MKVWAGSARGVRSTLSVLCALALASGPAAAQRSRVEVVHPEREDVERVIVLPGSVRADMEVTVHAKVSGFVTRMHVDIGDRVGAGDVISRLQVPEMEAEVPVLEARIDAARESAAALLAEAVAAGARVEEPRRVFHMLREAKERAPDTVAEKDLAVAEARLQEARAAEGAANAAAKEAGARMIVARAELARARELMRLAEITAPFDGVVTMRHVDPGALLHAGSESPVVELAKVDVLRVGVDVPESEARFARPGCRAALEFDGLPGTSYRAEVSRVSGALEPGTRSLRAEIDVENDGRLMPGMFGRVRLSLETREGALLVPSSAVIMSAAGPKVLVVAEGRVKSRAVAIGIDDGVRVEIREGLAADDVVVRGGSGAAAEGDVVETVMASREPSAGAGS